MLILQVLVFLLKFLESELEVLHSRRLLPSALEGALGRTRLLTFLGTLLTSFLHNFTELAVDYTLPRVFFTGFSLVSNTWLAYNLVVFLRYAFVV